ncbi:MAG: inorganic diphosphatase [Thermoproteota archaeon]|jgi:inorganic pyrophosphatase
MRPLWYIGPGENAPDEINVIIEIPKGGHVKYEVDERTGMLTVDRFLFTSFMYPFNYGFVPLSLAEDGDALDAVVLCDAELVPGSVIKVRPIGALLTKDERGRDVKVITVPTKNIDPQTSVIDDIDDLSEATKKQIEYFFKHYKELEPGKFVEIVGWSDSKGAKEIVAKAIRSFKEKEYSEV